MESEIMLQAIVGATKATQDRYEKMSGGLWLDDAPEYFLTSQLSVELNDRLGLYCTLEEPMVNFPLGRGAPGHQLRRNGKADIALWGDDDQIVAIVEVKNNVYHTSCTDDLHRLAIFSRRVSGRPIGAFAYFQTIEARHEKACRELSKLSQNNLRQTIEGAINTYELQVEHMCFASEPVQYDEDLFYGYLAHASTLRVRT